MNLFLIYKKEPDTPEGPISRTTNEKKKTKEKASSNSILKKPIFDTRSHHFHFTEVWKDRFDNPS
jgi:hypothetical protein